MLVCYYAPCDAGACCCAERPNGRYVAVFNSETEVVSPRLGKNDWVLAFTDEALGGDKAADMCEMRALSRKRGWLTVSVYAYTQDGKTSFSLSAELFRYYLCGYAFTRLSKFGRRADAARIRKALHALREELKVLSAWRNGEVYDVVLFGGEIPIVWGDVVVGFENVKHAAETLLKADAQAAKE